VLTDDVDENAKKKKKKKRRAKKTPAVPLTTDDADGVAIAPLSSAMIKFKKQRQLMTFSELFSRRAVSEVSHRCVLRFTVLLTV
jgi:hypothetical protein